MFVSSSEPVMYRAYCLLHCGPNEKYFNYIAIILFKVVVVSAELGTGACLRLYSCEYHCNLHTIYYCMILGVARHYWD